VPHELLSFLQSEDGILALWELAVGEESADLRKHTFQARKIANGLRPASASDDPVVKRVTARGWWMRLDRAVKLATNTLAIGAPKRPRRTYPFSMGPRLLTDRLFRWPKPGEITLENVCRAEVLDLDRLSSEHSVRAILNILSNARQHSMPG